MAWLWSSAPADKETVLSEPDDVYADLDPSLRDFARDRGAAATKDQPMPAHGRTPASVGQATDLPAELRGTLANNKSRKSQINAGAMFNCSEAQYALKQCFSTGSWWDKSRLCELQKGAFWDCLESNKKALNILGYAEAGNSPERDQTLLEAADDLYLRQLEARKFEAAEREGK